MDKSVFTTHEDEDYLNRQMSALQAYDWCFQNRGDACAIGTSLDEYKTHQCIRFASIYDEKYNLPHNSLLRE